MILYVDKKTLHESLRDDESGPHPAGAQNGSHPGPEQPYDGGPLSAHDEHRREILVRVVRISDALNQRLAL